MTTTLYPILMIPLGGILILLTTRNKDKEIGLFTAVMILIEALRLWVSMEEGTSEFQYVTKINLIEGIGLNPVLGIDGVSILYIILTAILMPVAILASWDNIKIYNKEFIICLISIELLLIGVFSVLDILGFYICFEGVLIPMYLIIGIWGARQEKVTAAYYFFFYTLIGSVLMLLSIFFIYSVTGTTDYITLLGQEINPDIQNILFLGFFASLAVKIPKFPFHIWLPQAHVEAPVAGSVLLAGILIKLGSYGFIRFTLPLFPAACIYFTPLVFTLGVLSIIYGSLTTLRQIDLKRIIAYSSVSHMGVVMLAIFSLSVVGIEGSIFLQIAHGVVSSALFIIVTALYDRHHTRIVKYYRGMAVTMPIFAIMFLVFTLANIAVPLSCNFIGEFMSLLAAFQVSPFIGILASTGMVLSACYALFLYNRVCFGSMSKYLVGSLHNQDLNKREFMVLLPLLFLTIYLGVYPNIILDSLHPCVHFIVSFLSSPT
jgi:proton-translocating NADH-quinone oxidoreductase chain M